MTTKADTSVKWFISSTSGAPVLRGQAGALIEVLDACLVNGFCVRTPDSFTVAGGVATLTFGGGNPYPQHAVIVITNASNATLNDEWRIATADATTITFNCPGVSNGTITSASAKLAPAGWEKPFEDVGSHKAVYRSKNVFSTGHHLRVLDSATQYARVRGYESMSDVDTGVNPFPTLTQASESNASWPKSTSADATPRAWVVVGDSRFFHYIPTWHSSYDWEDFFCFGDLQPLFSADVYCSYIGAPQVSALSWPTQALFYAHSIGASGYCPRTLSGSYAPFQPYAIQSNGPGSTNDNNSILTDSAIFCPALMAITSNASYGPRAVFPGVFVTVNHVDITNRKKIVDINGDKAILLRVGQSGSAPLPRMRTTAITIDGWRK